MQFFGDVVLIHFTYLLIQLSFWINVLIFFVILERFFIRLIMMVVLLLEIHFELNILRQVPQLLHILGIYDIG